MHNINQYEGLRLSEEEYEKDERILQGKGDNLIPRYQEVW